MLGATAVMGWIEGQPFWSYGLADRRPAVHFFVAWLAGFVYLSLLVVLLTVGGYLAFGGLALHGLPILGYGLAWLLGFVVVGMTEETLFRGYLQATLTRGIGFWPAAIVLSLVFAATHIGNAGETVFGIAAVVLGGLLFFAAPSRERIALVGNWFSRSLGLGPEGSLFAQPVVIVGALALAWLWQRFKSPGGSEAAPLSA